MESTLNKIGILTFVANVDHGVFNYTKSLIDALKNDLTNEYILFCNESDDRFDNYNLEKRKLSKPKNNLFKKILTFIQFIFLIRKPYLLTKDELDLFHDIKFFISPAVTAYPHFFLNKPLPFEKIYPWQLKYHLCPYILSQVPVRAAYIQKQIPIIPAYLQFH